MNDMLWQTDPILQYPLTEKFNSEIDSTLPHKQFHGVPSLYVILLLILATYSILAYGTIFSHSSGRQDSSTVGSGVYSIMGWAQLAEGGGRIFYIFFIILC